MRSDASFGVIPFRLADGAARFLLVRHKAGHWGFPKGHAEAGETAVGAALRELREETGLSVAHLIEAPCFKEQYVFTKAKSGKAVQKTVTYFLGRIDPAALTTCPKEIADARWGDADATRDRLTFEESRALFDRVLAHLAETAGA